MGSQPPRAWPLPIAEFIRVGTKGPSSRLSARALRIHLTEEPDYDGHL